MIIVEMLHRVIVDFVPFHDPCWQEPWRIRSSTCDLDEKVALELHYDLADDIQRERERESESLGTGMKRSLSR
jgi:hypothetical protein